MNVEVFKAAQEAYAKGDYKAALEGFIECTHDVAGLAPADLSKFYHLIGNCYVKSDDPRSAAEYYLKALTGSPEKRKPSLYVNLGTALLGTKDYTNALEAFGRALDYPIYTTPYKAYAGIGAAQLKLGNMVEAGAAYREAALDPANPAPAKSLVNLGVCFMELDRPADAVAVYETALDFDMDDHARSKAYANLGQAYMAQGRVPRALEAFDKARELGEALPSMAEHDYEIAKVVQERLDSRAPGVLETGFIPPVFTEAPAEDEEGFDPFAPKTLPPEDEEAPAEDAEEAQAPEEAEEQEAEQDADQAEPIDEDLSTAETVAMKAIVVPEQGEAPEEDAAEEGAVAAAAVAAGVAAGAAGAQVEGAEAAENGAYDSGMDERPFTYNNEPGYEYGVRFEFGDQYADAREQQDLPPQETNMPSPENTAFFDVSEQQINSDAAKDKREDRKAKGLGLKIALFIVTILIVVAATCGIGYLLGFGYPSQEDVTEEFLSTVQKGGDTGKYWASNVDASMQKSQVASLQGLKSYSVDAVQRNMNHTKVYVKATLDEGGQINYEVVLTRKGVSWVVDYVQLYFPSEQ